jgi:hypothetical protein
MPPCARDGERPGRRGLGLQHGTRSEPQLRIVGPDLDCQLAADAVRPAYPADYKLHGS